MPPFDLEKPKVQKSPDHSQIFAIFGFGYAELAFCYLVWGILTGAHLGGINKLWKYTHQKKS